MDRNRPGKTRDGRWRARPLNCENDEFDRTVRLTLQFNLFEKDAAVKAQASSADVDAGTKGRRWFKENCEAVSQRYMLSRRETEVLFYLAKGHNSAYIQEKLFISEGTAKTHIRHIYRKLDIHNQQELMRMVEKGE